MEFDLATVKLPLMARFGIALFLMLLVPHLTARLRIPLVVGYILVGVVLGPHGVSVLPERGEVANFFAELGKLLLMFFVGLEVDLRLFRENRNRAFLFGVVTFSLPMLAGTAVGLAFGYGTVSAILIGSLLASHTLIAYPMVAAAGLGKLPSVNVTVGATILTDMASLLVLALCVTTHRTGFEWMSLLRQLAELAFFIFVMVGILGRVGRWVFDKAGRSEGASFTLMLMIVAFGACLAELLNLEGILGAFLAGLAVNEAVRGTSAKEKIEFIGNQFFVPAFFVVTGFLVDMKLFVETVVSTPGMVAAIVLGLIGSKWLAAQAVGHAWKYPAAERGLMGSLTMPQVAATLAAALVGYQAMNKAGERLLDQPMLNTVLVLVIVTSVVGPILTERYIRRCGAQAAPSPAHPVLGRARTGIDG